LFFAEENDLSSPKSPCFVAVLFQPVNIFGFFLREGVELLFYFS